MLLKCKTDSFARSSEAHTATNKSKPRQGLRPKTNRVKNVARHGARLYCDGSSRLSNGISGLGVVLHYHRNKKTRFASKRVDDGSLDSFEAEYRAVLYGLHFAERFLQNCSLLVMTDQLTVVKHLNLRCELQKDSFNELRRQVLEIAKKFPRVKFIWVPRSENKEAHQLARKASENQFTTYDYEQGAKISVKVENGCVRLAFEQLEV